MAEIDQDMKEIKVMIFSGDLARFADSSFNDVVLKDRFAQSKGFTIQQFSYNCELSRNEVNTVYGQSGNVIVDFSIRVMRNDQILFYEKLKELAADRFSFVFNGSFDNGQFKDFDSAIVVDGYVVDVEEHAANDEQQALMTVKLLARELTYVHKSGTHLVLNISNN